MGVDKFFKRVYIDFFQLSIVFSKQTRIMILGYGVLLIIFSGLVKILCDNNCTFFSMLFFTGGLMMMPFFLYFGVSLSSFLIKKLKGESTEDKRSIKDKFESYLQWTNFVLLYAWVCILLILSLMVIGNL